MAVLNVVLKIFLLPLIYFTILKQFIIKYIFQIYLYAIIVNIWLINEN